MLFASLSFFSAVDTAFATASSWLVAADLSSDLSCWISVSLAALAFCACWFALARARAISVALDFSASARRS